MHWTVLGQAAQSDSALAVVIENAEQIAAYNIAHTLAFRGEATAPSSGWTRLLSITTRAWRKSRCRACSPTSTPTRADCLSWIDSPLIRARTLPAWTTRRPGGIQMTGLRRCTPKCTLTIGT
jgi:hypothetical protein